MRVESARLAAAIRFVSIVRNVGKNTIPILDCVHFKAEGGELTLSMTDLDNYLSITIPCTGHDIEFCQPQAWRLAPLIRQGGAEMTEFLRTEKGIRMAAGAVGMYLGATLDAADMPQAWEIVEGWSGSLGADFMATLRRVQTVASKEQTRYYLNGVFFEHEADWRYKLTATNGHQLATADTPIPDGLIIDAFKPQIIPNGMLKLMHFIHAADKSAPLSLLMGGQVLRRNVADKASLIDRVSSHWSFNILAKTKIGRIHLVGKTIDGTFPDYRRVIPSKFTTNVVVDRDQLVKALAALGSVQFERSRAVKVRVEAERMILSHKNIEMGIEPEIAVPIEVKGEPMTIGFNGGYLAQLANASAGKSVRLDMAAAGNEASLVYDPDKEGFRSVLMPMRV